MPLKAKFPARLVLIAVAAAVLMPIDTVPAQEPGDWRGVINRLNRLQEQVYDLRDSGYGGGAQQLQGSVSADPATQAGLALRIDNVEGQMRNLTGQIEQLAYQVQQLNERFNRFSEDVEFRFRENGNGRSGSLGAPRNTNKVANAQRRKRVQNDTSSNSGGSALPDSVLDGGSENSEYIESTDDVVRLNTAPGPSVLGTIPADNQQTASLVPEAVTSQPLDGDSGGYGNSASGPDGLYQESHEKMLRRQFGAAEAGFKKFLRNYPKNKLAGNAQYWLGETYYARRQYKLAARAFLTGYKNHKKSAKAPDNLVKLGMTLARLGQKKQACATLSEAQKRFPRAAAVRTVAKKERSRAGC